MYNEHWSNWEPCAHKCRTISLSQYNFNLFWKHFYLFSLYSYVKVFFLYFSLSSSYLSVAGDSFSHLLICSRSLLSMYSFHFTLCVYLHCFVFVSYRCVLLNARPQSVFDLDSSIWWTEHSSHHTSCLYTCQYIFRHTFFSRCFIFISFCVRYFFFCFASITGIRQCFFNEKKNSAYIYFFYVPPIGIRK